MKKINENFTTLYKRWKNNSIRKEDKFEYEYVDLDLPSGKLWATCNIGSKSPFECGNYYAWGEIEEKERYLLMTYKFFDKGKITKYNNIDNKKLLDNEDDVAFIETKGESHIPTYKDFKELINNTNNEWCEINDTKGRLFVSLKDENKKIFIPISGYKSDEKYIEDDVIILWASNKKTDLEKFSVSFYDSCLSNWSKKLVSANISFGYNVRGIKDKK